MKLGYAILKQYLKVGLFCYYKKTKVFGRGNIPVNKPIIFLANHQNALMDALIIVMNIGMAPYFLTRSDVFKKPWIGKFLRYLQMIPIYRFRDGRETLKKNPAIFDTCGALLGKGKALMLFPEGNHGIQRRVRWPMRKGFVKMIFRAMEKNPELDIRIVPIGLNYLHADRFPDSVALYIGKDIRVRDHVDPKDLSATETLLKEVVYARLKQLTTHIGDEGAYDIVLNQLENRNVDYLDPLTVNNMIAEIDPTVKFSGIKPQKNTPWGAYVLGFLFKVLNFPMVILWEKALKPMKMDIEFRATMRFAMGMLLFPIYHILLFSIMAYYLGFVVAFALTLVHLLFNLIYVKQGQSIS